MWGLQGGHDEEQNVLDDVLGKRKGDCGGTARANDEAMAERGGGARFGASTDLGGKTNERIRAATDLYRGSGGGEEDVRADHMGSSVDDDARGQDTTDGMTDGELGGGWRRDGQSK